MNDKALWEQIYEEVSKRLDMPGIKAVIDYAKGIIKQPLDILENPGVFLNMIWLVVQTVEHISRESLITWGKDLQSEDKRKAAAKLLDDIIPLPPPYEYFDRFIFGILITLAVTFFNRYLSKWEDVSPEERAMSIMLEDFPTYEMGTAQELDEETKFYQSGR